MRTKTLLPLFALLLLAPASASAQKVFINPSNQIHNAVAGGGTEDVYARANATITKNILQAAGFTVTVDDDFDNAPSRANSWGAQLYLSVHSNAGGGHGTETLWGVTSGSQTAASKVQSGMIAKLPYSSRGTKDGTWAFVLRTTHMPACLAEVVFHDCASSSGYTGHPPSESSYLKSSSGQQAIGSGMANGVCSYFNKSCSGSTPPATKGWIKGVVYKNGDINQHVAPATVKTNTGATTTYDGNAVWSFEVNAGNYTITASAAGYKTATKTCPAVVAGQTAWCSIELEADTTAGKGFIKGVVYTGALTNHVAPATVKTNTGATTTYDGSAVWSFELAPGSYSITASATGYATGTRACPDPVVAGQTSWCSIEITPEAGPTKGWLKGVVFQNGDTSDHVAPASVRLNTGASTTYGGTSEWAFELDPGSYSVTASAEGYLEKTAECPEAVTAGGTAWCNVEIVPIPPPEPDAGVIEEPEDASTPEPDAGVVVVPDAGISKPDAGTQPKTDAGTAPPSGEVPELPDSSCGCSSTSSGLLGLFGLLALPLTLPRRRRGLGA